MAHDGVVLHCGSERTTLAQVLQVPVPEATPTWSPVGYGLAIDFLRETARTRLGLEVKSESYGLNKAGSQLFARITLDTGDAEKGLSIGMRQSYDKSLALGLAGGANVFVCDNLCFSGDAFRVIRRNTTNVWVDFQRLVHEQVATALDSYEKLNQQTVAMKGKPCHKDRGYALLGVAMGRGLLTPHQASVAFGDWDTPRHEEFSDRNIWSLYNAVTEGLKKGSPATVLERHTKAHDYFVSVAN
jgi:hypothetical protein